MRVFSACMKMMKGHKATLLIYVTVFAGLLLTMTFMGDSGVYSGFQGQRPKYALINRDEDSALVQGLAEVLEHTGTRIELEDSREAMADAGFYQAVECIFLIPEGYGEKLKKGADAALEMWQWPSSASGYYLRSAAEQYLLLVQMYQKTGDMTDKGIAEAVAASMEKDTTVEMRQYMDGAAVSEKIRLYQRFLPYVLLLLSISCVSVVFINFRKPEIRMRNLCSPIRPFSFAVQRFLYACVVGAGAWGLLNLMGALFCLKDWKGVDGRIVLLLLGNGLAVTLVAVSLALLCSTIVNDEKSMSFISNIVSLGICFLSGVFVPQEFFGAGLLRIAKLLPVYWYEKNEERICGLTGFTAENLMPVYRGVLIQLGFAAAFFCIYLLVSKSQQQSEEDFGTVRTEIEQ